MFPDKQRFEIGNVVLEKRLSVSSGRFRELAQNFAGTRQTFAGWPATRLSAGIL
jgi:hypothetical protein